MRAAAHWVTLVLAALVALLSLVAIWTRNQVVDTDRYVRTVAPLATEPSIQDLVANALADRERLTTFTRDVPPPRAEPLASPIAAAVEGFIRDQIGDFVRSPEFAELWEGISRRTHDAAVALLTGEGENRLAIVGDKLVVRLGPLVGPARAAVERAGLKAPLGEVSEQEPEIVLGDASSIESARGGVDLLQKLAWVLPALTLLCLLAAVVLARDRRRGIMRAGLALVAGMVVLGAALLIGRSLYLDAVSGTELPENAAAAAFDTLLQHLRNGLLGVLAVGALIALAAVIAGRRAGRPPRSSTPAPA